MKRMPPGSTLFAQLVVVAAAAAGARNFSTADGLNYLNVARVASHIEMQEIL